MTRNFDYPMPYHGKMARSSLEQTERDARALRTMLQDGDEIPLWCHYKIAVAAHDIAKVRNYMQYEIEQRKLPVKVRTNPAGADQVEALRLANAIDRATSKLLKDMRSSDPVTRSAAQQLRALLLTQPQNATAFIQEMRANLAKTDAATVGARYPLLVKIYTRMAQLWAAAQQQP